MLNKSLWFPSCVSVGSEGHGDNNNLDDMAEMRVSHVTTLGKNGSISSLTESPTVPAGISRKHIAPHLKKVMTAWCMLPPDLCLAISACVTGCQYYFFSCNFCGPIHSWKGTTVLCRLSLLCYYPPTGVFCGSAPCTLYIYISGGSTGKSVIMHEL